MWWAILALVLAALFGSVCGSLAVTLGWQVWIAFALGAAWRFVAIKADRWRAAPPPPGTGK